MIELIHTLKNKFWNSTDCSKMNAEIITIDVHNPCIIVYLVCRRLT